MISVSQKGGFNKIEKFFDYFKIDRFGSILEKYGELGVSALSAATPVKTGLTASSWTYEIQGSGRDRKIVWKNSNVNKGVVIALLIQNGHGTGTGGYVAGIDYINPALRPVFDKMAEDIWKEVANT